MSARAGSRRSDGAWGRFAAALAVLGLVVVGIPALLLVCARAGLGSASPLPGIGSADEIRNFFERQLTTTEIVPIAVRALLIVAWLLWAGLVSSVVVAMLQAKGHRASGLPRLAMFSGLARWIAAGLAAIATLTPSVAVGAPTVRAPAYSLVANHALPTGTRSVPAAPRPVASGFARVQAGESIEMFAERTLGDPGRWTELWDLNQHRAVGEQGERWVAPWKVSAGWDLRLPARAAPSAARPSTATVVGVHDVVAGDSYWAIAESLLPPDATPGAVLDYTNALIEANASRLGYDDPHMLRPGDVLDVVAAPSVAPVSPPAVASHRVVAGDSYWAIAEETLGDAAPAADVATRTHELIELNASRLGYDDVRMIHPGDEVVLGVEASAQPPVAEVFDDLWSAPTPQPPAPPTTVPPTTTTLPPPTTTSTTTTTTTSTTTTLPPPIAPGGGSVSAGDHVSPGRSPIGVGEAGLLAAGILALLGARRRARLRAAEAPARLPLPRPQSVALERRLRAIGSSERLLRVDVALRAAAPAVAAHDQRVLLVRVGADGTIELILSGPAELPAPWERAGTWWSLPPQVAVDELAATARTVGAPCVAVTTLGTDSGGCEVLVDVEALGVLSIDAGDRADDVARAIAVGLASSELAEVAHLVGVGLDADGGSSCLLGHRNATVVDTLDEAIELGTELIGARSETRSRNTFALRTRHSGGEAWEPAVVIVASAHAAGVAGAVLADVTARPGLALVVAGPVPGAPWTLVARATAWTLQPLGLSLTPVGVSVEEAGELAALIEPAEVVEVVAPDEVVEGAASAVDDAFAAVVGHDLFASVSSVEQFPPIVIDDAGTAVPPVTANDGNGHAVGNGNGHPAAASNGHQIVGSRPHVMIPEWDLLVTLVGPVGVVDRDGGATSFERAKSLELVAWLVTHREQASRGAARTALWEHEVRHATFANVVSDARRAMARHVEPPPDDEWLRRTLTDELSLHPRVLADADVMRARLDASTALAHDEAMAMLRPAVELVRGLPFAATSYLWPDPEGITSEFVVLATSVCRRHAELALEVGAVDDVFWSTGRGLAVLAGHEALIGLRMRAHALGGDLAALRHEWDTYERAITADSWSDGKPAPQLVELRKQLLNR